MALRQVHEEGKELTADNAAEALASIQNWESGGFFGVPVSMQGNKIGTGRVYQYSAETNLFTPASDWFTV
jgi:branched-chain amino acid transport system substrate-binding protein